MKLKFAIYNEKYEDVFYDYGKIYELEVNEYYSRIKIGASTHQVGMLIDLLYHLKPPYYLLYVLVVSRLNNELGRYQSPILKTKEEVIDFLLDFKDYFETDGRSHLWIGTLENNGTLILDQHNVIFGNGPLEAFQKTLELQNYSPFEFDFPAPHIHNFHDENDTFENQILDYWDWEIFPLEESDEYD